MARESEILFGSGTPLLLIDQSMAGMMLKNSRSLAMAAMPQRYRNATIALFSSMVKKQLFSSMAVPPWNPG
ncbi:MAG: hypothetical protein R6V54_11320 [Desulfobacteraceae bacterium]